MPHRLYGFVDGAVAFSVGGWLEAAEIEIGEARATGRLPIIVGGTGLYFTLLTQGIAPIPAIPPDIRDDVRSASEARDAPALHATLQACDPQTAAQLRPSDRQRIIRALEVVRGTGTPLAVWQTRRQRPLLDRADAVAIVVAPDRDALRARVSTRFASMLEQGALAEVAALVARGLDPALPVMKALGVAPLAAHLRGEATLDEAAERATGDTRRYVKRQLTWARGHMADWTWTTPDDAVRRAAELLASPGVASLESA